MSLDFPDSSRYEVRRQLGHGGFGVVYEAFDRDRDETVALKALTFAEADSLYCFKREFRVLSEISHHHVVELYDLDVADGTWFFTMELVKGVDFLSYTRMENPSAASPISDVNAPETFFEANEGRTAELLPSTAPFTGRPAHHSAPSAQPGGAWDGSTKVVGWRANGSPAGKSVEGR